MPPPRASKYQPLAAYLAAQPVAAVTLSFAQIEALLQRPLSPTAYLRQWWTSTTVSYIQVQSWRAAGWSVTAVAWRDGDRWVTFQRGR